MNMTVKNVAISNVIERVFFSLLIVVIPRAIDTCSKPDYREKLAEELKELRNSELWQAGAAVRLLRPEKATVEASMIN